VSKISKKLRKLQKIKYLTSTILFNNMMSPVGAATKGRVIKPIASKVDFSLKGGDVPT
jgi:hypothetical protein